MLPQNADRAVGLGSTVFGDVQRYIPTPLVLKKISPERIYMGKWHIEYTPRFNMPMERENRDRSHGINCRSRRDLLVLVTEFRYLKESVHAVSLQAMQFQATCPVLRIDSAHRESDAQP